MFGFVLGADRDAIDGVLNRDLVEPARGAVDYRCASESVIVIFATIERLGSGDGRDRLRGYVRELEASVWCLAADVSAGSRLVWYLPYLFADPGQAVASGREVYGYPKQAGVFAPDYPQALDQGGTTTVEALAIHPYDPNRKAELRPMISVERAPQLAGAQAVKGSGAGAFADLSELFAASLDVSGTLPFGPAPQASGAITPLSAPPPPPSPPGVPAWAARRVLDTLLGRSQRDDPAALIGEMADDPTLVFLKQFRDVSCPTKACYQAVVEAPLIADFASARYDALDRTLFEVTVGDWDSHPIASELGLQPATATAPQAAFRARLDFEIGLGLEVWRA